ncbi:[protein-PII] uridylyltransferase [Streptomyces buecherae]|uniref:Bifunctional uridylyltransferase/uridylyl-removing enzyme n=1 Tax=Streptomyces buecherae TaxID=2763006 RepID=A0A7H8NJR2_9ACTN|nr:[protein-PII] uridylyltransferase [Streptomyces buecherae]
MNGARGTGPWDTEHGAWSTRRPGPPEPGAEHSVVSDEPGGRDPQSRAPFGAGAAPGADDDARGAGREAGSASRGHGAEWRGVGGQGGRHATEHGAGGTGRTRPPTGHGARGAGLDISIAEQSGRWGPAATPPETAGALAASPLAAPPHGWPTVAVRGVSLVAVGGYGRGELSPRSDLDVLLLHDGSADAAALAALADQIWYPIWDLSLALDHSVRTVTEAREAAAGDLKAHLGLLDARHLAGDAELTARLRSVSLADWRASARQRLPELHELCQERARRHGELRFLLEPNLKEARGGLRDVTALRAVAASWLADAPRAGLEQAHSRLLDVRDALHLVTGRSTERLALQDQDEVAAHLGLLDADTLLREVYEAARTISYAADAAWREVHRVLRVGRPRPGRRGPRRGGGTGHAGTGHGAMGHAGTEHAGTGHGATGHGAYAAGRGARSVDGARTPLADGVVEHEGEAVLARAARPDRDPVLPLRAAAAAAQAGLCLSVHTVRRLADAAPLPTPWPAAAREQLITLLGAGDALVPVWEALEAEGLISRLLPDWERVRCRPQRNPVHRWTVDRHLIETAARAGALCRRVGRPDLLLLAALLHDIGKGWPGDHSVAGETIAHDMATRIGLDAPDAAVLATLVRHHLLLVDTATRRDLDDPATVRLVARAVRSPSTLELLHALTEADALATGPAAWSAWRASLVAELARRVAAQLRGEPPVAHAANQAPTAEQERLATEAWRTGEPALALHPRTEPYATVTGRHVATGAGVSAAGPVPAAETPAVQQESVGVELLMAAPDRPGTLTTAAGVLAIHGLTVRSADLRTVTLPAALADGPPAWGDQLMADGRGPAPASPIKATPTAHRPPPTSPTANPHRPDRHERAGAEGDAEPDPKPRSPDVLLLTWRVAAAYGALPHATRLRHDLSRALNGSLDVAARLTEREQAHPPRRGAPAAAPRVTVAPDGSQYATVLEVRAQDAPGLLHRIGRALEDAGVAVRSAHISTLGAHAVDAFYVTDPAGTPLSEKRAVALARALERALS